MALVLCYPFKPGAFLAVEMTRQRVAGSRLVKVIHVTDQANGTWLLGCEFVDPVSEAELQTLS